MMKKLMVINLLALSLFFSACDDSSSSKTDPCEGVTCSEHGTCTVEGTTASCDCDEGYVQTVADPTSCVLDGCVPQCTDKVCGDDGCEGSCGTCSEFDLSFCTPLGQCDCTSYLSCGEALSAASVECGTVSDGCGGTMDCTDVCPGGDTCGGGGVGNVCGHGCVPYPNCTDALTVASLECGVVADGCLGTMDCTDVCTGGDTCGGGGIGNVCGHGVGEAPVITVQPQPAAVNNPSTATFSVTAVSASPMTYVWSKNGLPIVPAATGPSYTTPPTSPSDDGAVYSVVVSNPFGDTPSDSATLKVIWHRLFVTGTTGVLAWDNPRTMTTARPPDFTLNVASAVAVTQSGHRLYVYSSTSGILLFDNALSPTLSSATVPVVTIPNTAFSPALPAGSGIERLIARPPGGVEGLWAWGFLTGAYHFSGPFTAATTSRAQFTHSWQQTPSLYFKAASSTSVDRLYLGQISGAGLLAWNSPTADTGSPLHDFASTPNAVWALASSSTRLFGGGVYGGTPGIGVWNNLEGFGSARTHDLLLGGATATFFSTDFITDLWGDGTALAAAVQGGDGHRLLLWSNADSASEMTAPDYLASLSTRSPERVLGAGGGMYFVLTPNGVVLFAIPMAGSNLIEVLTLPGSGLLDLALVN